MLDRTRQPHIRPMRPFEIQHPSEHRMPNGIPVHVINSGDAEVVRLDIMIRGGQWEQERPLQATFTSRMLREGTVHYSSAEIAEKLDYYGAWLDVSSSMNYSFITLYSLNKYFSSTLPIVASMLKEPVFPEKELSVVIEANKQQYLVNREKVEVIARKKLNVNLFGESHPCARYAVLEDYDKLTPDILRDMHSRFYHSGNCSCYLSGCVTDEMLSLLEKELGQFEWGTQQTIPELTDICPQGEKSKRVFIERTDALQSAIRLGCFTLDDKHPDSLKLKLLITLFGGYFGSRLMKNIREEKGYTYGISAGLVPYPFRNMLIVSTQAANEYACPIIEEVYREIDRLHNEKVPQSELSMVKNYTIGDLCRTYESPFSLADAYIYLDTYGLKGDYFLRMQQEVLETTAEDIMDLARKYLRKDELTEVIAGKKM